MLSHLRFHRRGASNPASPTTDQQPCYSPLSNHESPSVPDPGSPFDAPLPKSASSSALPPTLPPITLVTSSDADLADAGLGDGDILAPPDARPRTQHSGDFSFIGGVALRNYRREVQAQQPGAAPSADFAPGSPENQSRSRRPQFATAGPQEHLRPLFKAPTSFSTPTELHNTATVAVGKKSAASRLPSEPAPQSASSSGTEQHRGRKGLPFLKNPMSTLLMRRKNNQNVPDIRPLPLTNPKDEPAYDPRIRGTRVHDFSAPRRKLDSSSHDVQTTSSSRQAVAAIPHDDLPPQPIHATVPEAHQRSHASNVSDSMPPGPLAAAQHADSLSPIRSPGMTKAFPDQQVLVLVEDKPAPPVPPKDHPPLAARPASSMSPSKASEDDGQELQTVHPSTRTARSRNVSLSEISALPKHMKSTSSRFSFDMIGAAKQEKLLEERHRRRELEKKSTVAEGTRDSRFDDFDDDAFDYDAMMEDDGLEEKIPGVNADLDDDGETGFDDELDPDNDQENFAGFVFQRSNPASSLTSPKSTGVIVTPRDAEGQVIGCAMTKDMPDPAALSLPANAQPRSLNRALNDDMSGLGIRAPSGAPRKTNDDDLYFDDGLIDPTGEFAEDLAMELEFDAAPFDESIFDNNDTDQYGRPVPGAFAQAQMQRRAAAQDVAVKRESDVTSRFSIQSVMSRSTAHTSPCVDSQKDYDSEDQALHELHHSEAITAGQFTDLENDPMAAYQAALAAAAHKAAASGKFQRSSSPPRGEGELQASSEQSPCGLDLLAEPTDDDFGSGYEDVGDFDLDDDAIIAEANASALANDSDGWYGQEFGFYSTPAGQQPHSTHNVASSKSTGFEYANGGFFGPKGMGGLDRSTSGRMVSREPNLTPITERSEYSNRNSFMSLGFPPLSSSTPMIQSPGLAQLAMMADRGDEQMTLSALLRLRSKAWGGSQASLASSKDGSPKSERGEATGSPWALNMAGSLPHPGNTYGRNNSFLSTASRDSDGASASGSPTLTMAVPMLSSPCPANLPSNDQSAAFFAGSKLPSSFFTYSGERSAQACGSPAKEPSEAALSAASGRSSSEPTRGSEDSSSSEPAPGRRRGHHRHNSSADSVSYLMEEDHGETRWIMERRRTGESGQVEILEREVVEGGRI
ncbi:hypothetical protein CDD83_10961 [Cordyceps sp. RAO-2017]|nr:hypothetical protein CDD83_10961 [Cordyceps sp. RAO-2017]